MNRRSFFKLLGAGAAAAAVAPSVLARGISADAIAEASRVFAHARGGTVIICSTPGPPRFYEGTPWWVEHEPIIPIDTNAGRQGGKTIATALAKGDEQRIDFRPVFDDWPGLAETVAASLAEAINEALA